MPKPHAVDWAELSDEELLAAMASLPQYAEPWVRVAPFWSRTLHGGESARQREFGFVKVYEAGNGRYEVSPPLMRLRPGAYNALWDCGAKGTLQEVQEAVDDVLRGHGFRLLGNVTSAAADSKEEA